MIDNRFNKKNQDLILELVADQFACTIEDLLSRNRSSRNSNGRHVAMVLMRNLLDCTLMEIAKVFGRDHTTVIHAKKKIDADKKLIDTALRLAIKYKNLSELIDE